MSRNMSTRTARDKGHRIDSCRNESPGLIVRQFCPVCGLKKHSSTPHPKCSRELQRRYLAERANG